LALIPVNLHRGVLGRHWDEVCSDDNLFVDGPLKTLILFGIYGEELFHKIGLLDYLYKNYHGVYRIHSTDDLMESALPVVRFIDGSNISDQQLHILLRSFLNGERIIVFNLAERFKSKIELFLLENSLKVESIRYRLLLQLISLGDGKLFLVSGDELFKSDNEVRLEFWTRLVGLLNHNHIFLPYENDGIEFHWRVRSAHSNELSYSEVRRVGLYNYSSYKKKILLPLSKDFVLIKILDQLKSRVESLPQEVAVELMPEGAVSLDLGLIG
jgi:hypothetical protein